MPGADDLPQASADLLRRMHDVEEGRRVNAVGIVEAMALGKSAQGAVVDLKEDIHDLKNTAKSILTVATEAATEARDAARQGRITNGRVGSLEQWRDKHESDIEPVLAKAKDGFATLARIEQWHDTEVRTAAEKNAVRRWFREQRQNLWAFIIALAIIAEKIVNVVDAPW